MLDSARRIPAYIKIAEQISQQISGGKLAPGDRLPAEDKLASAHQVSRMTVRQALQELTHDGLLVRRHGLGTFVVRAKVPRPATRMTGFHEELVASGFSPSSRILELDLRPAKSSLAKRLGVEEKARIVYIHRLRFVGSEPAAENWNFLRADLCAPLLKTDLSNRGLYELIEQACHISLGWVEQRVEARPASKQVADHLEIRPGAPLLFVERLTYSKDDRVIGLMESLYRSDRYVLTSVLYR